MFSLSTAQPYRSTQMILLYNYGIRITHVTSDGLLAKCRTYHASCSVSPFINRNLCAALFIPTSTLVSALIRFGVYWWCQQTLKGVRAETNTWVGIKSVMNKCWLLHGDNRWVYHLTSWHIITYEKSQKGQASISCMSGECVRNVWVVCT